MHPYLPHLLSDITAAHQNEPSENFYVDDVNEDQAFEKHIEEVERYIAGEEQAHTFGYYCGLQSINFPPPEQLDNDDLKKVCDAFKKMMLTYNLSIDLPDNLPLLSKHLQNKLVAFNEIIKLSIPFQFKFSQK